MTFYGRNLNDFRSKSECPSQAPLDSVMDERFPQPGRAAICNSFTSNIYYIDIYVYYYIPGQ